MHLEGAVHHVLLLMVQTARQEIDQAGPRIEAFLLQNLRDDQTCSMRKLPHKRTHSPTRIEISCFVSIQSVSLGIPHERRITTLGSAITFATSSLTY